MAKKPKNTSPIGIFDSGLGGLTIFKAVKKALPAESIIYFGDTAHVPYGSKSAATVTKYSLEIGRFLEEQGVKMLIVACNTASALALPTLRKKLAVPVVGVIEPSASEAVAGTKNNKISVIATDATVRSLSYPREIKKASKKAKVLQKACPLFVPVIEENYVGTKAAELIIKDYMKDIKKNGSDTVILGCTHYPIIKKYIQKEMGKNVTLIDSADSVARFTGAMLTGRNMRTSAKKPVYKMYSSDAPGMFKERAEKLLKIKTGKVTLKKFS
ncbi:glutamate racemase [Parelusimicrobium proximum]|uniref:glutamate racemase n=1 Tax=Parelusimicrobium proximum TaxID=3228953 RepID=UPI003D167BAD